MNRNGTKQLGCLGVIAITIVSFAVAMNARTSDAGCEEKPRGLTRAIDAMQLDDATQAEVDAVFENAREHKQGLRDEMKEARQSLRDLLAAAEPQEAAVLAQADVLASLESARHRHRAETLLAVRRLVSAEAWAEFQEHHPRGLREGRRFRR